MRLGYCLAFLLISIVASPSASTTFRFEDYAVTNIFRAKPAEVDLTSDPQARRYRTMLRTQTKEGPNFAGKYRLASWGCGTCCEGFAFVNCETGQVRFIKELPFVTCTYPNEGDKPLLDFRLNSRLLIVNRSRQEEVETSETHYYLWDGEKLKLLGQNVKVRKR